MSLYLLVLFELLIVATQNFVVQCQSVLNVLFGAYWCFGKVIVSNY